MNEDALTNGVCASPGAAEGLVALLACVVSSAAGADATRAMEAARSRIWVTAIISIYDLIVDCC